MRRPKERHTAFRAVTTVKSWQIRGPDGCYMEHAGRNAHGHLFDVFVPTEVEPIGTFLMFPGGTYGAYTDDGLVMSEDGYPGEILRWIAAREREFNAGTVPGGRAS